MVTTTPEYEREIMQRHLALLKEARQYVADAGSYEEPGEHQAALLSDIDAALKPDTAVAQRINPWAHIPKQYEGRWCFDYKEHGGEGWFFVYCNGYEILRSEDSEVCSAVCYARNAWLDKVKPIETVTENKV